MMQLKEERMARGLFNLILLSLVFSFCTGAAVTEDMLVIGKRFFSAGNFRKAAVLFQSYVESHPDSTEAYEWLGKSYHRLGDNEVAVDIGALDKAVVAFRSGISLSPHRPELHLHLGMVYLALDDKASAMKEHELLKGMDKEMSEHLLEKIRGHSFPPAYRVVRETGNTLVTPVTILGNQVLVPVTLGKDGYEVQAHLLLDTGAGITSIHSDVAARMHISEAKTQKGVGQVVGGGLLQVRQTKLAYISAGPHTKSDLSVAIVEHKGPPVPYEGLLGMNFLRNLHYTIDFRNSTIKWHQ